MDSWRLRGLKRRNERQTKIPDVRALSGSKKDTKKWCRGVVGREHSPQCRSYNETKNYKLSNEWKILVCTKCGKHLDYYFPHTFFGEPPLKKPPSWVK